MISLQHHYGAASANSSTPFWMVEGDHQFGANEWVSSSNNIQVLREAKGWSRPRLAKLMNTSAQQIERLEKGSRSLRQAWIDKAAAAFDVPATAIIAPDISHYLPVDGLVGQANNLVVVSTEQNAAVASSMPSEGVVTLRSFDLSYAMGPGTNIDDYVEEGAYEFDAGTLSRITRAPADQLFVARADGDSMFPTLLTEDLVVIDTTQKVLNLRDRIWACSIYGAGAIKRLRPLAKGKVEVISDNPAVKDDVVDAEDIHIVGRVIWLGRRV